MNPDFDTPTVRRILRRQERPYRVSSLAKSWFRCKIFLNLKKIYLQVRTRPSAQLYHTLSEGMIRLLRLRPGNSLRTIECTFTYADLNNLNLLDPDWHPHRLEPDPLDSPRGYVALSYTWGQQLPSVPIIINGRIKMVSENLYLALLHLRQRRYKTIWIDALCINQDDLQERAAQVQRMKDIYEQAFLVYIWLGDSDRFTTRGFDELSRMLSYASMGIQPEKFFDSGSPIPQRTEIFRSISDIVYRPWFRRMWVIQEVLAAKSSVMACGNDVMFVTDFLDAIKFMVDAGALRKVVSRHPNRPELTDGGPLMRATKQLEFLIQAKLENFRNSGFKRNLLDFLAASRWAEATDPRDKVYGILSIAEDAATLGYRNEKNEWFPFNVDYTISKERVFINATKSILYTSQSLEILLFAGKTQMESNGPSSWVPNWASKNPEPVTRYTPDSGPDQRYEMNSKLWRPYHECSRSSDCLCEMRRQITLCCPASFTLGASDTLAVRGIHYDTITDVSRESWPSNSLIYKVNLNSYHDAVAELNDHLGSIQEWIEDCTQISTKCSPYPTGEITSEVLWKLLHPGPVLEDPPELYPHDGHLGNINAVRATFAFTRAKYLSTGPSEPGLPDKLDTPVDLLTEKDLERLLPQVMNLLPSDSVKKFATTKKKYMGLVPPNARAGDLICIMYGCETPFILRRCGRRKVFELIGHSSFHGISFDNVVVESSFPGSKPGEAERPYDLTTRNCRTNRIMYTKLKETQIFILI
ncbi:heterokaryon incompatibility protein-domain-containing protein [Xylogone sp. PMI_703]|nr:heterokaryon incompatibility protein-domain-containing protein [Xylogone sp. PMI_703]